MLEAGKCWNTGEKLTENAVNVVGCNGLNAYVLPKSVC